MTTGTTHQSNDELVKRLQIVVRDLASATDDLARRDTDARELRNLVEELATRVHDEPEQWGIAGIPAEVRDDVAADTLLMLISTVADFRGAQPVTEWFAEAARERGEQLRELREQAATRAAEARPKGPKGKDTVPPVFGDPLWHDFERSFPPEALALRLRYLLDRAPEEMVDVLGVSSARAVGMRVNRARDRFRAFCERNGPDLRAADALVGQLGEGSRR